MYTNTGTLMPTTHTHTHTQSLSYARPHTGKLWNLWIFPYLRRKSLQLQPHHHHQPAKAAAPDNEILYHLHNHFKNLHHSLSLSLSLSRCCIKNLEFCLLKLVIKLVNEASMTMRNKLKIVGGEGGGNTRKNNVIGGRKHWWCPDHQHAQNLFRAGVGWVSSFFVLKMASSSFWSSS